MDASYGTVFRGLLNLKFVKEEADGGVGVMVSTLTWCCGRRDCNEEGDGGVGWRGAGSHNLGTRARSASHGTLLRGSDAAGDLQTSQTPT